MQQNFYEFFITISSHSKTPQQANGVFDPRGIRQMDADASAWLIARRNKSFLEKHLAWCCAIFSLQQHYIFPI